MRAELVELSPQPVDRLPGFDALPPVLAVADDEIRGRRVASALARQGGSVAPACSVEEALAAGSTEPWVVVFSCDGLRGEAIDALRRLATLPAVLLVVVAPAATPADVRAVLGAGVQGLVLDEAIETALVPTITAVASGQLVLPATARQLAPPVLSKREKQVLALVVLGFSNADIAAQLHVTEATVKSHLTSSFAKLGVRSRSEASARILDPHEGLGTGILSIPHGDVRPDVFEG